MAGVYQYRDELLQQTTELLKASVDEEYARKIANHIIADVQEDIIANADTKYNEADIKLAIGRCFMDTLDLWT